MKQHIALRLQDDIKVALATGREIHYSDTGCQKIWTVKAIYGRFLEVTPVDGSDSFSISLGNPMLKRDRFWFSAI